MKSNINISASELEIMQVIWDLGRKVTTGELCQRLPQKKLTTISTLAGRLIDKGVLRSEKVGRSHAHEYEALISEEEYQRMQTQAFIRTVYKGSASGMISALVKADGLTRQDIDQLKKILDEMGNKDD